MARPRSVSDEQILAAARGCFLEHGPGVSTTVIAQRLGLSQAALFKRFGTKDELLRAAMTPERDALDGLLARLERGPDERAIPMQLLELGRLLRSCFEQVLPRIAVLKAAGLSPHPPWKQDDPPPLVVQRAVARWLRRAADAGRLRVDNPEVAAHALLGALHFQSFLAFTAGGRSLPAGDDPQVCQLVELMWHGLDPGSEAAP